MMKMTFALSAALLLTATTYAQNSPLNLVQNPGFETGTTHWTLSPTVQKSSIVYSTISGLGSKALRFEHVHGTDAATIEQDLNAPDGLHRLRLFAGFTVPPGGLVTLESSLLNLRTRTYHFSDRQYVRNRTNGIQTMAITRDLLPRAAITNDLYRLSVSVRFTGALLQSCTAELDEIELSRIRLPMTSLSQIDSLPQDAAELVAQVGLTNQIVLHYLSWKRLTSPVTIPGVDGSLQLDPSLLVMIPAKYRSATTWYTPLPVWPAALRGIPFFAQTLSIDRSSFVLRLGSDSRHTIR